MHRTVFVLAYVVSSSHVLRVNAADLDALKSLARIFLTPDSAAGWQVGATGHVRGPGQRGIPRHAGVSMQVKDAVMSEVPGTIIKDKRGSLDLLDEDAMHKASAFALSPQECVERAQAFIAANYGQADTSVLADDFQFIGPFVGPLERVGYIEAMEGALNPQDGFPDLCGRQFGFTADPVEPGRVWWFTRPTGTFKKDWFGAEADGKRIETAPQSMGVVLNEAGQVRKFNMGTPIDRTSGNSGGLGGLFAFMWFVGKPLPIPECRPYEKSVPFKILSQVGTFLSQAARAAKK